MKTTIELPDELIREIKIKAAREDRKLKDVVEELLRRGLNQPPPSRTRNRVQFPIIHSPHKARPGRELTPDRVAETLMQQEIDALSDR